MELKELTTLVAASIAAIASLTTLAVSLAEKRRTELREAQRAALEPHVVALGESMYGVVAASQRMATSADEVRFRKHKERATQSATELDRVRRQVRYTLWGLNDHLHDLVLLPRWIEFLRSNRAASQQLLKQATDLRVALDEVIRACYLNGRAPSTQQTANASALRDSLRSTYQASKGESKKTAEAEEDDA